MSKLYILVGLLLIPLALNAQTPDIVPGEAIIRFSSNAFQGLTYRIQNNSVLTNKQSVNTILSTTGISKIEPLHSSVEGVSGTIKSKMERTYVVHYSAQSNVQQVIAQLRTNPSIEYAQPNYLYTTFDTPSDEYYSQQWSLPKIGMPSAWNIQKGATDIRVAVLDVGFKLDHEDLQTKFSTDYKRDETDIDTANFRRMKGGMPYPVQFISGEDYTTPDNDPTGKHPHGTQVSGVVGAATNNNTGIAGVGWNTIIVPVRCGFGYYFENTLYGYLESDDWIRALDWVRINNAARVVNLSFGISSFTSDPIDAEATSINAAIAAGIVICAASGNGMEGHVYYPAAYDGVIAVGATDQNDLRCTWSCYGFALSISAPGQDIYTTTFDNMYNDAYDFKSGTSFAAPLVAGAAALILSMNPYLTPANVKSILEQSATKVPAMGGSDFHDEYGYGRLNVEKAFSTTPLVQFVNNIQNSESQGTLVVDNIIQHPLASGSQLLFPKNSVHSVRTNELPFWQNMVNGTTWKHHRWFESQSEYSLIHSFTAIVPSEATAKDIKKDARFVETKPATVSVQLIDGGPADSIQFRDPWRYYKDASNNWYQSNTFNKALILDIQGSNSYGGVFLNQGGPDPNNLTPPYYSVCAPSTQANINGFTGYFQSWIATDADGL